MVDSLEFEVVLFPDPVLRREAEDVTVFDTELAQLVERMYERMFASRGVGLAAPQVGISKRILVLNDESDREQPERNLTLINPTITARTGKKVKFDEGCLSFPSIYAEITRPDRCRVEAFDVEGNKFEGEYEGFVSRIIQHEHDHLEGVLLVDRMTPGDKLRNKADLEELRDRYRAARA